MRYANDARPSKSTVFNEALFLASQDLYDEVHLPHSRDLKKQLKVDLSVLKYWVRACTRCTPFGLFAGGLMLDLTESPTSIVLKANQAHNRKVRLDMVCLTEIVNELLKNSTIRENVKVYPNDSLYEVNEEYRYAEYEIEDSKRKYKLSSIPKTDYLSKIISKSAEGFTIRELAKYLSYIEDVENEEALDYIMELWNAQIIVSSIEPNITGEDPLGLLIEELKIKNLSTPILDQLVKIQSILNTPNVGIVDYIKVQQELKFFSVKSKNILQVDLSLTPRNVNVNKDVVQEILHQLDKLLVLKTASEAFDLKVFKDKFLLKYGHQSVPLTLVMDSEFGIGYSYLSEGHQDNLGLLNELNLNYKTGAPEEYVTFDYIQKLAVIKFNEYLVADKKVIEITDEDLKDIEAYTKDLNVANSLYTMGNLHSQNGKIDANNFLYDLILIGGPCAGSLLGRFTCDDAKLLEGVKECLKEEEKEYPDAIFAEIVHLPQSRVGNILRRPILRDYEIPYLGHSGVDKEHQINIQDLNVSIENGQVILRSIKHKKRVIPRLTTAHNFMVRNLPLYKFLCDLQTQGNAFATFWDWGTLNIFSHLPRVMYRNIIIKRERWIIKQKDIFSSSSDNTTTNEAVRSYLRQYKIPSRVGVVQGQNEFLLDFTTDGGVEMLKDFLNKFKEIVVQEYLFSEENCIVRDTSGNPYTNEIIIPITKAVAPKEDSGKFMEYSTQDTKFYLGSEWLYFKVYASNDILFPLLTEIILPFIQQNDQVLFEKFFFVRYFDTGNHIRFRFYNSNVNKQPALQQMFVNLLADLYKSGKIKNVNIDIYERENNRYDERLIVQAESLFFNDSLFALKSLKLLSGCENDIQMYLNVIKSIDVLMSDFKFSIVDKYELLKILQKSFFEEFKGDKILQKQLNDKYRIYRDDISNILNKQQEKSLDVDLYLEILQERSVKNKIFINEIFEKIISGDTIYNLFDLLPSYIHMSINRMFESNQRKHELVIYHLLERYYKSALSKSTLKNVINS